jgi:hypothetical protein
MTVTVVILWQDRYTIGLTRYPDPQVQGDVVFPPAERTIDVQERRGLSLNGPPKGVLIERNDDRQLAIPDLEIKWPVIFLEVDVGWHRSHFIEGCRLRYEMEMYPEI